MRSVDLVADPASTTGLYEGTDGNAGTSNAFPGHTSFVEALRGEPASSPIPRGAAFADSIRE